MGRMKKSDPVISGEQPPEEKGPELQYPYYTVRWDEDQLYTLLKWDFGGSEPAEEYTVQLRARSVSCSCPGMRHFYGGREEEHKHIKIVRMFAADQKLGDVSVLRAYWVDKKSEQIQSRVLLRTADLEL